MKTPLLLFIALAVAPPATVSVQHFKGYVSDATCVKKIDRDCTKKCLRAGTAPVLVLDDTNDVLSLSPLGLVQPFAGEHVEITGVRSGHALTTSSVRALSTPQTDADSDVDRYRGNYQIGADHVVGIDTFVNDSGSKVLLFSNFQSGAVRELFKTTDRKYELGPGFAVRSPVQLTVEFRTENTHVTAMRLTSSDGRVDIASRIPTTEQPVSFRSGDADLRGTLIRPAGGTAAPAIVLLHGSGPLTRSSFGPYPRFFVSLGFAVFVYDKRGSGASTGEYLPKDSSYPQPFVNDALAAIAFLKSQPGIRATEIGLWGSSEGGMLTTQVAAQSKDVAFVINSSGFMMPLWKEMLYNRSAELRAEGASQAEADEAAHYQQRLFDVGATGDGWAALHEDTLTLKTRKWFARFFETETPSLDTLRWRWEHVYSFDPVPNLARVHCPVLGLFGELDTSTPPQLAVANMQHTLKEAGNDDVTLRIIPRANHSLMVATTGAEEENSKAPGLASEVLVDLREWLRRHRAS